ncbi:MAG: DUF5615 family PIN-like protein [Gammaproteobacteria bacterium]|nr:DUF5615 family PIN-like protein [Gammaproteobacteria bacterium]MCY4282765.1 DUF5615 family PIN-like protein [Gammaproteobacteria bacterium]
MKLLLDESVDHELAAHFPERFEVKTVTEMGWSGTDNGELLRIAAAAGFKALITVDKNIEFQQNLDNLPTAVIILSTPRSVIDYLKPLIKEVTSTLESDPGKKLIKIRKAI